MAMIEIRPVEPTEIRAALRLSLATRHRASASPERHVTTSIEYAPAM